MRDNPKLVEKMIAKRERVLAYIEPVKDRDVERAPGERKAKVHSFVVEKPKPKKRRANRSKRGVKWHAPHEYRDIFRKGGEES